MAVLNGRIPWDDETQRFPPIQQLGQEGIAC